jgi:hypothetical protein
MRRMRVHERAGGPLVPSPSVTAGRQRYGFQIGASGGH